jgi:hypothetical protein
MSTTVYYFIWSAMNTAPKTIDSNAFLYYRLTRVARCRIHKSRRSQTNNEQDRTTQQCNVANRAYRIYLGMNGTLIVSASATATADLVRRHCDNLAALAY